MPVATTWRYGADPTDISSGLVMGILNVTPDSFSGDGLGDDHGAAIARGIALRERGAAMVDVGGESTRPGAERVAVQDELARVVPVIEALVGIGFDVSIDTSKAAVAERALGLGAKVVNDVRACREPGMAGLVARSGCGVVLVHNEGVPKSNDPRHLIAEVEQFLLARVDELVAAGADPDRIAIDPGIGFGKSMEHNLAILGSLHRLASHGMPLVLGTSRKRFLSTLTGSSEISELDQATAMTTALGFVNGARVFRVHEAATSRRALSLAAAIVRRQQWDEWLPDSNRGDSPG